MARVPPKPVAPDVSKIEELLTEWHNLNAQLAPMVEREKELRLQIFGMAFAAPKIGTNKIRLSHGMALVGDHRVNYRIDKPALETARPFIPAEVFENVIQYDPRIRESAFRNLDPQGKAMFAPFVTEKPGLPGLEIKKADKLRW